ncbi:MAG: aminoacyl-histidine dipeptidase [Eubacterium sp.]|nr:aminoacyl-histidine dipeptidase [Eubacterium sp.]MDY5496526.1 aminoacyl-histidine dipeptidase [Anaerobutyricum sp.]
MGVLDKLVPEKVFYYFEEICKIPHGSRNTKAISDYCVAFARDRGLAVTQDEDNNVIIFKEGSEGYEQSRPVIIQGHLDMVCEKEEGCIIDFEKDGLDLAIDGDYIYARGTTLGGDDGIAVAMALAILDDDSIVHPPLEVVLTVDEEIGMLGAVSMDCSPLKGRLMLNLDSEVEGQFLIGCAGGMTAKCVFPAARRRWGGKPVSVSVSGVTGGHSGVEIIKEGANANVVLGRVLYALKKKTDFALISVDGGIKDNAITRSARAVLMLAPGEEEVFEEILTKMQEILVKEYRKTDPDICVTGSTELSGEEEACAERWLPMTEKCGNAVITALRCLPFGVQKMSPDMKGLVQTSLNPGILKTEDGAVTISLSVRSSMASEKEELFERLVCLTESLDGHVTREGDYPAWEYKEDSELRTLMGEVYREMFEKEPVMEVIHAGVECGLFSEKLPGLDCVSYGPDIHDIHTPKERLSIGSTKRIYEYTVEVLKRLK